MLKHETDSNHLDKDELPNTWHMGGNSLRSIGNYPRCNWGSLSESSIGPARYLIVLQ
jgi:hypothetical protein